MGYNSVFLWGLFMSRSPTSEQTALESTLKQFPLGPGSEGAGDTKTIPPADLFTFSDIVIFQDIA